MHQNGGKPDRKRTDAFMKKHLFDILHFAENPTDSLHTSINMKYGVELAPARIDHFVNIIVADIFRKMRPWYKHPRWHIHHWQITFPGLRAIYRNYFQKCDICHKRNFKNSSAYSDWNGTKVWCNDCNNKHAAKPSPLAS